ncbi:thioredoxin superfamily protein [Striga asiatica]|uniref:Thioredoxin superfamily protein n=1 Tax=Striga asiatica TaxID=4170 RepID=A0A5A7Q744_STRAF|nr:thioredoxin superfamily protein [Striga asiatica]
MGLGSKKLSVVLLLLLCLLSPIAGQNGLWYGDKSLKAGQILIEAFFDPVCPDSRNSWPPLKEVLKYYGDRVKLITRLFPLPYHANAFVASRAITIVNDVVSTSSAYLLLEAFFNNQETFSGNSTFNLSRAVVTDRIVKFSSKAVGHSQSAIQSGFQNDETDYLTRVGFKQGGIRGVYGTPQFFVNGFIFAEPGSAQNYSTWRAVLDPLVSK